MTGSSCCPVGGEFIHSLPIGLILAFNVSLSKAVASVAKKKGVQILSHNVIYNLLEQLKVSVAIPDAPKFVLPH